MQVSTLFIFISLDMCRMSSNQTWDTFLSLTKPFVQQMVGSSFCGTAMQKSSCSSNSRYSMFAVLLSTCQIIRIPHNQHHNNWHQRLTITNYNPANDGFQKMTVRTAFWGACNSFLFRISGCFIFHQYWQHLEGGTAKRRNYCTTIRHVPCTKNLQHINWYTLK